MYLKLNLKAAHSLAVSDSADAANSHSESAADSESESEFPRSGCQWQDHWHWQSPPGPGSPAPAGAAGAGTAAHWHCGTLRLRLRVRVHFKPELNSAAGGLSPGISSLSCQLQCQCRLQPESRWDRRDAVGIMASSGSIDTAAAHQSKSAGTPPYSSSCSGCATRVLLLRCTGQP